MNSSFRVLISLPHHFKTKKLIKRLGYKAFYNLITLWAWTTQNKPDGIFTDMDRGDIESAAGWDGECGDFMDALMDLKWAELQDGIYALHNWQETQRFKINFERCNTSQWKKLRRRAFEFDNFTCQYCGYNGDNLECDHMVPHSRGGPDSFDNLITSCPRCNRSKRDKTVREWLSCY